MLSMRKKIHFRMYLREENESNNRATKIKLWKKKMHKAIRHNKSCLCPMAKKSNLNDNLMSKAQTDNSKLSIGFLSQRIFSLSK